MQILESKLPPLVVVLIVGLGMWAMSQVSPTLEAPRALALGLCAFFTLCGAACALAGVLSFKRALTTVNPTRPEQASSLVCSGVYRFTRNPMYLGFFLALVGWGCALQSPLGLAFSPALVLYLTRFQIRPEERALEALFGEAFLDYKARVRRWL